MHSKETLAKFIYELDKESPFLVKGTLWSAPVVGFSHNKSLPKEFIKELLKADILQNETICDVICILGDWGSAAEGIIFTDRAIYINSPKNKDKKFRVEYNDVSTLYSLGEPSMPMQIRTNQDIIYTIDTELWNKLNIYNFLQFATEKYDFDEKDKDNIVNIKLKIESNESIGSTISGTTFGNVSNASSIYFDDKLMTPKGHGFAAERANHLADLYSGKDAQLVGDDNALNGADRIVDGIAIQSKYCVSGSKCVRECFDKSGQFRYWNASDKSPMQIEVPSDKYEDAVRALEHRIKNGGIHGKVKIDGKEYECSVTDPAEAKNIIRKGRFTYAQAKNIAKAGTVESIIYDAASGAIIATYSFGITSLLSFAVARWNGEDFEVALKSAAAQGLKVGGITFVSSVLAGQLSKAGFNSMLIASSEKIVRLIGPKASAVLVNAFRSGKNIYGAAAMKSASKMLRSNVITSVASFAVLSSFDVVNIFRGRISGGQLFKNLTNTAASIGGGYVGWTGGAAAGAAIGSVIPGVGTAVGATVGGLIGALGGGSAASSLSGAVLDEFIEDDANEMVAIIQEVFTELASEYLVTQEEAERITDSLKDKLNGSTLKDMFASSERRGFARSLLTDYFEEEAKNREHITLPTEEQMQSGLKALLEDIADSDESEDFDEYED